MELHECPGARLWSLGKVPSVGIRWVRCFAPVLDQDPPHRDGSVTFGVVVVVP